MEPKAFGTNAAYIEGRPERIPVRPNEIEENESVYAYVQRIIPTAERNRVNSMRS